MFYSILKINQLKEKVYFSSKKSKKREQRIIKVYIFAAF